MFLARDRREAGASTAEYAGLIVLAALIAAALFTVIPTPIGNGVSNALCKIFNLANPGKCRQQQTSAENKYKPKTCTTQTSSNQIGIDEDVSYVRVGGNLTFLKTKSSDGTVTLTAVQGVKAGAQDSVGFGVHGGKAFNFGGDLGGDATLNFGAGDGWTFKNEADAKKFTDEIERREASDAIGKTGAAGWGLNKLYKTVAGPPDYPPPNIKRYEGSVDINGNGSLGVTVGPKPKKEETTKWDRRGRNNFSPNADVYAGVNGNAKAIYEKDSKTKQTSATVQLSGGFNLGEQHPLPWFFGKEHQNQRNWTGAVTLKTDDRTGKLVELDIAGTQTANGTATVTTTKLPVTDENRARVERSIGGIVSYNSRASESGYPGPDQDELDLEKEIDKNGQVQKVDYNITGPGPESYGANGKAGPIALGGALNLGSSTQTVKDAQYLGAPGADGRRKFVPFKECHN